MELFKAHQQWAVRPADETFSNVSTAFEAAKAYARTAAEKPDVPLSSIRTEADEKEVYLTGRGGMPARVGNWAFGQLCRVAEAPAGYLRELPATLAVQNLNYGLKTASNADPQAKVNILAHKNGDLLVRALTSAKYRRIWNWEVLGRMLPLEADGWSCPTPFRTKVDQAAKPDPTVYVSDHDMFAFQVYENARIAEPGNPDGLARGFFVENSEVGASALRVTTFLYRFICSNHIVWGSKDVSELAVRHVGKARGNLQTMFLGLTDYLNESASEVEGKIKLARTRLIDADPDKVLDLIFSKLRGTVSRDTLTKSLLLASENSATDGDPRSFWGLAQGITRYSQTLAFADQRVAVDQAAAAVIDLAF
jgi:hypothetical protein